MAMGGGYHRRLLVLARRMATRRLTRPTARGRDGKTSGDGNGLVTSFSSRQPLPSVSKMSKQNFRMSSFVYLTRHDFMPSRIIPRVSIHVVVWMTSGRNDVRNVASVTVARERATEGSVRRFLLGANRERRCGRPAISSRAWERGRRERTTTARALA